MAIFEIKWLLKGWVQFAKCKISNKSALNGINVMNTVFTLNGIIQIFASVLDLVNILEVYEAN